MRKALTIVMIVFFPITFLVFLVYSIAGGLWDLCYDWAGDVLGKGSIRGR